MGLLGGDFESLTAAMSTLRAQLGTLPSRSWVQQTSGPVAVTASAKFDAAMYAAADGLGRQLGRVTQLLDDHATDLRGAAELLGGAENDADVLVSALDTANEAIATQTATPPAVEPTAAGTAAQTGWKK